MHNAYAQALWRIIEAGTAPKVAVKTLHEALAARGRLGLLPRISRAFNLIATRAEAKNTVTLKVVRHADGKQALKEAAELFKDIGIKEGDVRINVEENLIGGWRLEGQELLHDASYKRQLLDIYENVSGK
jgi:F0F1-type ATP synthase delta subunit